MKILIAVKNYWPSTGGVQSVTKYMAEGMAAKGHEVTVLTRKENGTDNNEEKNGVRILRIKQYNFFKFNFGDKIGFRKIVLDNTWDVVVSVCGQSYSSEWMFPLLRKIKARKILYMHGMRSSNLDLTKIYSVKNFFKESILTIWWNLYFKRYWKAITNYDAVIHLFKNDSSFTYFEQHGYEKNVAIANSCDSVFFEQVTKQNPSEKYSINAPYFIQVANYDENKNQLLTLKCFLNAKTFQSELVMIGSKENRYFKKMQFYLERYGGAKKDKVHLLVGLSRAETISLVKNAFATLLSSHSEYFPLSIIEGMAAGKPYISTHVGEVPKLIGGHVCKNKAEIQYWMEYYVAHPEYVIALGKEAGKFAKENMLLQNKINQFEQICEGQL